MSEKPKKPDHFQVRMGPAGRWLDPERDLVYLLPQLFSAALKRTAKMSDEELARRHVTMDRLAETARKLGKLSGQCNQALIKHEDLLAQLGQLDQEALSVVGGELLHVLLGRYWYWVLAAKPKTPNDPPLPFGDLADVDKFFLKG